jgi:biopolymer transport protein ExbD
MSGSVSSGVNAEPNLTPILDMVFQLITFFMLIINFQSAEIDQNLKLPVIGSAKPVTSKGDGVVVVNIDKEGNVRTMAPVRDVEKLFRIQASATLMAHRDLKATEDGKPTELPTTIVIRADSATPFQSLNRVIKAAQDNGFINFAFRASQPEPKPARKEG